MPPARRFLAPGAAAHPEIRLDTAESHHLRRVLRLAPGAAVEIFDGAGRAFEARFLGADPDGRCRLHRGPALSPKEPAVRLTMGIAVPKGDGFTRIARQLAEIGVAALTPLITEHSEGAPSPARLPRWRAAALSGSRQCGRAVVPAVVAPAAFASWVEEDLPADRWIASPRRTDDRLSPPPRRAPGERVLAIGPEGGFSADEMRSAALLGFVRLDLGERVLRTGTAALIAAAALLTTGDSGRPPR